MIKTFNQFINENDSTSTEDNTLEDSEIEDSEFETSEPKTSEDKSSAEYILKNYIQKSLQNISQFNIYHWLTTNEAQHLSIGEFYNNLQLSLDKIVEQSFVKYDVRNFSDFSEPTVLKFSFDIDELNKILEDYTKVVVDLITLLNSDMEDQNLVSELSVVLESIKTLQYKLQLS